MGYYSEVAIAITKNDYMKLRRKIQETNILADIEKNFILNSPKANEAKGVIVLYWDSIRWYYGCTEIDFIDEFLRELRINNRPYKFVRMGENVNDIQIENAYFDDTKEIEELSITIYYALDIVRYIKIDLNDEESSN